MPERPKEPHDHSGYDHRIARLQARQSKSVPSTLLIDPAGQQESTHVIKQEIDSYRLETHFSEIKISLTSKKARDTHGDKRDAGEDDKDQLITM